MPGGDKESPTITIHRQDGYYGLDLLIQIKELPEPPKLIIGFSISAEDALQSFFKKHQAILISKLEYNALERIETLIKGLH
jgi:hypothetical protein